MQTQSAPCIDGSVQADLIDTWVEDARGMIVSSAKITEYESVLKNDSEETRAKANAELADQVRDITLFSYINIANAQGEVRASSMPESVGKIKVPDREYFQKAMKGEVNISTVYLARTTGKPAFAIAAPIKDGDKIIGVIFGVPDLTRFSEKFVDPVKVGREGHIYLYDSKGVVIAHRDKSLIMKLNLKETEWGKGILQAAKGLYAYEFQKIAGTVYLAPCKNLLWTVAAYMPSREIAELSNTMTMINLILLIAGLVISIISIFLIVRAVVAPINNVTINLHGAADHVSSSSKEVANAGHSLAEGASEQASAIEETSSSLEELTAMTRRNADNAKEAKALMAEARHIVERVNGHVNSMAEAVGEVTRSSEETGKIIKTIDEIAFQTNLLALNAAVEAARAGEVGAGFAVVADEVRNLAVRAAEAAQSTSSLIENTISTVQKSQELTTKTQEAFKENMTIAGKVGSIVDEIAAASQEQAQGIDQISKAVLEMEKVVQRTAASAEESAAASEDMNAQSLKMKKIAEDLTTIVTGK